LETVASVTVSLPIPANVLRHDPRDKNVEQSKIIIRGSQLACYADRYKCRYGDFRDSFSLPDPKFDPVGPAGLPKIASIVLVVLCVFAASFEFLRLRFLIVNQMPYGLRIKGRVRTTVFFFLLAIAYISTLTWLPFGFAIPTTIFVYIAGLVLAPKNKYTVFGLAILAFAIGFGSDYIFSTLLNLVLPGTA
jgi:putative tricarboxylic transport membrane protein